MSSQAATAASCPTPNTRAIDRENVVSRILKALAWVAPGAASARLRTFAAIDAWRSYDAANRGRRGASFKRGADSANAALSTALKPLRDRSRDMSRNTWIGQRMLDVLCAHVVGTGIVVKFKDKTAQRLWNEWIKRSDVEGEIDFAGQQLAAVRAMLEGGDSLVRFVPRPLDTPGVPLRLQVLEGDFIDETRDGLVDERRVRLGVVLGEWDAREGFYIFPRHPGEAAVSVGGASGLSLSRFIPRSEFCHLFRALRPGQVRGVPLMAPMMMTARDFADLMDAVVVKARMEACIGLLITSSDGRTGLPGTVAQGEAPEPIDRLRPGMTMRFRDGETVQAFAPASTSQFEPIALSALQGIAAGGMITYDQLTGDLRRANYSSMKTGRIEHRRLVEQLQWLCVVPKLMEPVVERFLETAIMAGKLRRRVAPYTREYIMPANEPVDPLKDMQADILAVRSGRMTPQEFIASWGNDPDEVLQATADFWKAADEMGVILDTDPRRTTQTGAAQASEPEGRREDEG